MLILDVRNGFDHDYAHEQKRTFLNCTFAVERWAFASLNHVPTHHRPVFVRLCYRVNARAFLFRSTLPARSSQCRSEVKKSLICGFFMNDGGRSSFQLSP